MIELKCLRARRVNACIARISMAADPPLHFCKTIYNGLVHYTVQLDFIRTSRSVVVGMSCKSNFYGKLITPLHRRGFDQTDNPFIDNIFFVFCAFLATEESQMSLWIEDGELKVGAQLFGRRFRAPASN